MCHFLLLAPLQLIAVTLILWEDIGWPVLLGAGFLILLVPMVRSAYGRKEDREKLTSRNEGYL